MQGQTTDKHRTDNRQTPDRVGDILEVYVLCPVALNIIFLNIIVNFNFVPSKMLDPPKFYDPEHFDPRKSMTPNIFYLQICLTPGTFYPTNV